MGPEDRSSGPHNHRLRQPVFEPSESVSGRANRPPPTICEVQVPRVDAEPLSAAVLHLHPSRYGLRRMRKSVRESMTHEHHAMAPKLKFLLPVAARSYPTSPDPALVSLVYVYLRPKAFSDLRQPILEANEQLLEVEALGEAVKGHGKHNLVGRKPRWFNPVMAVKTAITGFFGFHKSRIPFKLGSVSDL